MLNFNKLDQSSTFLSPKAFKLACLKALQYNYFYAFDAVEPKYLK